MTIYFEYSPGYINRTPPFSGDVQHIHLPLRRNGIVSVQVVPVGTAMQAAPVGVYAVGEHPGSQIRYARHGGAAPWRRVRSHRGGHPTSTLKRRKVGLDQFAEETPPSFRYFIINLTKKNDVTI